MDISGELFRTMTKDVVIIGAGLAGSECAWQLARRQIPVKLIDMKPENYSQAHHSPLFAELVCSNSLRSNELSNAVGLLKEEMRRMDSLIMESADATKVPAGGALAVDRDGFSRYITEKLEMDPYVTVEHREVTEIPEGNVVIASGPLTSDSLAVSIQSMCPEFSLHFFDAVAPIVSAETIDMSSAFLASRYDKGTPDYINCPMNEQEYKDFIRELVSAEEAETHGFEDSKVFEGCMPVEVMARRGEDTLRFGSMKPVGLTDPHTGKEAYAIVQLRKDNLSGTMYNLVGFQTHLTWPEQKRIFSMIPALKNAEFVRYGVMHRNTYIDSPGHLDRYYRLISDPRIRFAGQMTGVEGYIESAASGMLVGIETAAEILGLEQADFPSTTAIGALAAYISGGSIGPFQPMNVNFGIIDPLGYRVKGKRNKNLELSKRALETVSAIKNKEVFRICE